MDADGALDSLVTEHGEQLLRLAYQLTHDRHAAQDVVQEALMNLVHNWRRQVPDNSFGYARRAVVNEFLRRRRLRSASEVVTDLVPSTTTAAVDAGVVDRNALWAALGELPPRQRAVLVLRCYEDLPDARIAELLDAKETTVRSLAARGLATLRASATVTHWSDR